MKKLIAFVLVAMLIIPLGLLFSTAEETNVAAGKDYTYTGQYYENEVLKYPDIGGVQLTDGVRGTKDNISYLDEVWVGMSWGGEGSERNQTNWDENVIAKNFIVVDLGSVTDDLTRFSLFSVECANVPRVKGVEVLISDNNTDFTSVGSVSIDNADMVVDLEDNDHPEYGIYEYSVSANEAKSARYVKFTITHKGGWAFASEVEVYQGSGGTGDESSDDVSEVPVEVYSLISFNADDWLTGDATYNDKTESATVTKSGDAIVVSGSEELWPYGYYNIAEPVEVNIADFELVYDFTVSGGKANIVLFCEGSTVEDNNNYINNLTHLMAEEGSEYRDEGADDIKDGTYTGRIDLSDLDLENVELADDEKITISAVKVFTVGGGVITLNKFALESKETVTPESSDPSEEESSQTSSEASSATSSEPVPTGDKGILTFAVIAVIALAGVSVAAVRKRR